LANKFQHLHGFLSFIDANGCPEDKVKIADAGGSVAAKNYADAASNLS
jgi:hypothetical protein